MFTLSWSWEWCKLTQRNEGPSYFPPFWNESWNYLKILTFLWYIEINTRHSECCHTYGIIAKYVTWKKKKKPVLKIHKLETSFFCPYINKSMKFKDAFQTVWTLFSHWYIKTKIINMTILHIWLSLWLNFCLYDTQKKNKIKLWLLAQISRPVQWQIKEMEAIQNLSKWIRLSFKQMYHSDANTFLCVSLY